MGCTNSTAKVSPACDQVVRPGTPSSHEYDGGEEHEHGSVDPVALAGERIPPYSSVIKPAVAGVELDLPLASALCDLSDIVYLDPATLSGQWCSTLPAPATPKMAELPIHLRHKLGHCIATKQTTREHKWHLRPLPAEYDTDMGHLNMHDGILYQRATSTEAMILTIDEAQADVPGALGEPAVFLVLRGTEVVLKDVLTDLSALKADDTTLGVGRVHSGFASAYDSIRDVVQRTMTKLFQPGAVYKRLIIAGHSLGGALTTLASGHLHTVLSAALGEKAPPILAYTFGEPRVGNAAFAEAHTRAVPQHWRFVNERDLVPQVPPTWLGYAHSGHLAFISEAGIYAGPKIGQCKLPRVRKDLSARLHDSLTDHLTYTAYVKQLRFHTALYAIPDADNALIKQAWATYVTPVSSALSVSISDDRWLGKQVWAATPRASHYAPRGQARNRCAIMYRTGTGTATVSLCRSLWHVCILRASVCTRMQVATTRVIAPNLHGLGSVLAAKLEERGCTADDVINEMRFQARETPCTYLHFASACAHTLYAPAELAARRRKVVALSTLHRKHDADADGFLQPDEFLAMCRQDQSLLDELGVHVPDDEAALQLFRDLDMGIRALSAVELGWLFALHSTHGEEALCDVDGDF